MHIRSLFALFLPLTLGASTPDIISTYAGGGPNNVPATQANLGYSVNTTVDTKGNLYIVVGSETAGYVNRVYRVSVSGTLTVLAGNGFGGDEGDGGPAIAAELYSPTAVAVDSSGNLYIADTGNCVIRKVTGTTGIISTFAGTPPTCGYGGDGGPAIQAELLNPTGVAADGKGNIYIADLQNNRIRKVDVSTGKISTIAGNGQPGYSGDGGPAIDAELFSAQSVAVDASGNVYISDLGNNRIRKVTAATGKISTIAGNGILGYSGDGGPATSAKIDLVYGIALDSSGRVFIADSGNCVVREVDTTGIITTVAGTPLTCGFTGDGGTATSAQLNQPYGVAVDSSDNMYLADFWNARIRKAALHGKIDTIAGNGTLSYAPGVTATGASLSVPQGASPDASGNLYIADTGNCLVRKVKLSTGQVAVIAGTLPIGAPPFTGTDNCGYSGDGGPATRAQLNSPARAIADPSGNVYISDTDNCVIRKINASTGSITTFAGTPGSCAYGGDGSAATDAQLWSPDGIALDRLGNLYIADFYNNVVREVIAGSGKIITVAGNHTKGGGFSGDSGPATDAQLFYPADLAFDGSGNLYIADENNNRVRLVTPSGIISTFAGNGAQYYAADGVPATETSLDIPSGVAVDAAGDVIIADTFDDRIRWVDGRGIIQTVAGTIYYGFSGDGGFGTNAKLAFPQGVGIDSAGNIYTADTNNLRIRKVTAIPNLNSSAYSLSFPEQPVGNTSDPQEISLVGVGPLTINSITTSGDFTEADDCPVNVPSGSSCNVDITFTPSAVGHRTGTVVIGTNGFFNPALTINLTGTGEGLTYTPAELNFGNQKVGTSSSARTITFTNHSAASVKFSSVTTTKTTFAIASNTCTGTLAGGKTCTIGMTFKPAATGLATATLVVKDSDSSSPQLIPLRGTGTD